MENVITPDRIARLVDIWYLSEGCNLVTHAWLCGLAIALSEQNPSKRFAEILKDAVLKMARDEFFALMSEEMK